MMSLNALPDGEYWVKHDETCSGEYWVKHDGTCSGENCVKLLFRYFCLKALQLLAFQNHHWHVLLTFVPWCTFTLQRSQMRCKRCGQHVRLAFNENDRSTTQMCGFFSGCPKKLHIAVLNN